MKTLKAPARLALRTAYRVSKAKTLHQALLPYAPVGWCAAFQKQGKAPLVFSDGLAVLPDTKVLSNTLFRVASISKMIGGAAAMLLVRRGMLSLDADIADVLQIHIDRTITLRQLLTHTASLSDAFAYDQAVEAQHFPPLDQLLAKSFLPHAPGTRFLYSNFGAGVAGMLVESASGMIFDEFVRKEFFTPYGIDASFHPQCILDQTRLANCYRVPGNELSYDARLIATMPLDEDPDPRHHYFIPAGKLMISAPDLLSVLHHLMSDLPELFVLQDHTGSVTCECGRGLGVSYMPKGILSANAFWGHQGVAYGALCEAWMDLEEKTIAVLLTNGVKLTTFSPLYRAGHVGLVSLLRDASDKGAL